MKIGIKRINRVTVTATVTLTAGAVLAGSAFASTAHAATPPTPKIVAKGGFVMNNGTGKTLFTKSADTRRATGSTTKIMTALVVLSQKNVNLKS
ncbi:D-alanyl-D-alanine carboxypeptidase, partial [Streptomyces sp. SID7499]|nr:D-alanyl-D-alanine carboxypeptidase [Streptomyces sp. SID7499]